MDNESETLLTYTREIRERWAVPLANEWYEKYPQLFDEDDLRLARSQPRNHFREWFAAIYLHERYGAISLVEKYLHTKNYHVRKGKILREQLNQTQLDILLEIANHRDGMRQGPKKAVQAPDLFVFLPGSKFWFVEVKDRREALSPRQVESHRAIRDRLGVPVHVFRVCEAK